MTDTLTTPRLFNDHDGRRCAISDCTNKADILLTFVNQHGVTIHQFPICKTCKELGRERSQ